jgi:hypothetical protein
MVFGIGLEVVGYLGRIMMHNNIFDWNAFLMYILSSSSPFHSSFLFFQCFKNIN